MPAQQKDANPAPNIDVTTPYTPRRPSPVISISVNHPIGAAVRKIKNFLPHKQTLFSTTFTIKVTPIVAIVSLFGLASLFGGGLTTAFNFGKTVEQRLLTAKPTPTPKIIVQTPAVLVTISRAGTIKATYQMPPDVSTTPHPTLSQTSNQGSLSATITIPTPTSKPAPPVLHYILVSRNESIIFLSSNPLVRLQNYLNLRVLITGSFDTTKNTLNIAKPEDIEVLQ